MGVCYSLEVPSPMQICEHTDILEVGPPLNGAAAELDDHGYYDHHYDVENVVGVRVDLLWCLCSFLCFLFQTLQQHQHIDILLTSWSEGAYYEEQDDFPQLHFEILPTHHLTRVRFHYNHMTLEIEWDLQSGPDATF